MNAVSLIGSTSRNAGGLFESVRRLHQVMLARNDLSSPPLEKLQLSVLALRDSFSSEDADTWRPVPLQCFGVWGPRSLGYSPALATSLLKSRADLVHVHGLWQFLSIAALRWHQKFHKPYLVSPHGMLDPWALKYSSTKKTLSWWLYEKKHLHRAACLRALCRAEVSSIRTLGFRNPVCLVPNGVDIPARTNKVEGKLQIKSGTEGGGEKVLLYLGRIHPKKGLNELLEGWAAARKSRDWFLVIAGWSQCGHEEELRRQAKALRILSTEREVALRNGSVLFVGPVFGAAKQHWLERCHGLILSSFSEGVPMAVLEAWAHGKPTLITPACNLPEGFAVGAAIKIQPERTSIREGLESFFSLPAAVRQKMGECGRDLVSRNFAWPKIGAQLQSVYRWLCNRGAKPDCVLEG